MKKFTAIALSLVLTRCGGLTPYTKYYDTVTDNGESDDTELPDDPEPELTQDQWQEFRVLVAYTSSAWNDAINTGRDPIAHAAMSIEFSNLIYSNSAVTHRAELADVVMIPQNEAAIFNDISTAATCPNYNANSVTCVTEYWVPDQLANIASQLAMARDAAAADVVMLLGDSFGAGAAFGVANEQQVSPYMNANAVIDYNRQDYGFAHELGHVLGAGHDFYKSLNTPQWSPPPGHSIDYGYTQTDLGAYTVMAYNDECEALSNGTNYTDVPWLSNPDALMHGQPLGGTVGADQEAFNACVVEHYGSQVSNYHEMRQGFETVAYAPPITSCPYDLTNTTHVGGNWCSGDFIFYNNTDLETDLMDCGTLVGNLTIEDGVDDLSALASLAVVEGDLTITAGSLRSLTTLTGLEALTRITGEFTLSGLGIDSLRPLTGLQHVGSLLIEGLDNPSFEYLSGLDNLSVIDNNLRIRLNRYLTGLFGLYRVTAIPGQLEIYGNQSLETLDGLDFLAHAGDILIESNIALESLNATYPANVPDEDQPLIIVGGLGALESAQDLDVKFNPALEDCTLSPTLSVTTSNNFDNGANCSF